MSVTIHVLLQVLGFIASAGVLLTNALPDKAKPFVVLTVSASQGLLAWYNHYYTPSGQKIQQS